MFPTRDRVGIDLVAVRWKPTGRLTLPAHAGILLSDEIEPTGTLELSRG